MNIGIRLHDTAPGSLEERLGFARAQGFSCAHLALSKVLDNFQMADAPKLLDDDLAARVRSAFDREGMGCAVLGCYLSLATRDVEALERTRDIYRAHLRFARMIGAGVVGTETPPAQSLGMDMAAAGTDEALSLFIECVRPLARCAEEEDAILAIEPVYGHIVSTPERAQRMLEALDSEHVRIILDAVNLLSSDMADHADAVIDDAIVRLGDRVSVLHMKDFVDAPGQPRPRSLACGRGRMNYESLLRLARERDLPMTLEDTAPDNAEQARIYLEQVDKQQRSSSS